MRGRRTAAWRGGVVAGFIALAALPAAAQSQTQAQAQSPAYREHAETFKDWRLYCQVWSEPRRAECELLSRPGSDRRSRLVWLRSSERWLEGMRFRLDDGTMDLSKIVRVWVDRALFRPEYPCERFEWETNTCAVVDPETNAKLVDRLTPGKEVSAVGSAPAGGKAEVRFSLNGLKPALERMEEIRREAGIRWK
ncbi:hypothetical protein [Azospirillum argentinense]